MDIIKLPPQEYLQECLDYDPETGSLFWKKRPLRHFDKKIGQSVFNAKFAGNRIENIRKNKEHKPHITVSINKIGYQAHRLIWMLVYGETPDQIDHINGDGTDNRLCNLRNVSSKVNNMNKRLRKNCKSGLYGVYWLKKYSKWMSSIGVDGEDIYLGWFDDFFDAVCARKSAEYRLGFHANHGRRS